MADDERGGRRRGAVHEVRRALVEASGRTSSALRQALVDNGPAPAALAPYVEKLRDHAYRITEADIAALAAAGFDDDAIFEVTVAGALGAGLVRLEAGLAAARERG